MARGITQEQVNDAIEQLLLSGERPTIERVRAALGTGSPNTLTRMLDTWWKGLGDRLAVQRRSAALPDAPAAVVDAASALWEVAVAAGQAHAEAAVAPERQRVAIDHRILEDRVGACNQIGDIEPVELPSGGVEYADVFGIPFDFTARHARHSDPCAEPRNRRCAENRHA